MSVLLCFLSVLSRLMPKAIDKKKPKLPRYRQTESHTLNRLPTACWNRTTRKKAKKKPRRAAAWGQTTQPPVRRFELAPNRLL